MLHYDRCHRLVNQRVFRMTEEELRACRNIRCAYASNNYNQSLEHVHALVECIRRDFPNVKDYELEVDRLTRETSDSFAEHVIVYVLVPADRIIEWRNNHDLSAIDWGIRSH